MCVTKNMPLGVVYKQRTGRYRYIAKSECLHYLGGSCDCATMKEFTIYHQYDP